MVFEGDLKLKLFFIFSRFLTGFEQFKRRLADSKKMLIFAPQIFYKPRFRTSNCKPLWQQELDYKDTEKKVNHFSI